MDAVDEPKSYGIIFRNPDGTLNRVVEKPEGLTPPQLANIGGYLFPKSVFNITLPLSPRGEYEITDAVSQLAAQGGFRVVERKNRAAQLRAPSPSGGSGADGGCAGGGVRSHGGYSGSESRFTIDKSDHVRAIELRSRS